MDNANLLKAAAMNWSTQCTLQDGLVSDYFRSLNLYLEVRTCSTGPMSLR